MKKSLSKEEIAYIERELYDYEFNKRELKELKLDIAYDGISPFIDDRPETNKESKTSVTERAGVELLSNRVILRMTRVLNSIGRALDQLNYEEHNFYILKYTHRLSWQRVCIEAGISERTYHRWRKKIILLVAKELGMI